MTAIEVLDLTRALIRCPSVTPAEAGTLDVLEAALKPLGFDCTRLTFDEDGPPVANLFARLGTGRPHLCFAGHVDVVPPGDAAAWSAGPFDAEVIDGTLFGRGAVDMKGGVAAFCAAAARYFDRHGPPPGSISLLITGDEEGPSLNGTIKVMGWLEQQGITLDACLVGEPTSVTALGDSMKIGRRGSLYVTLTVRGTQGHTAYPHLADNPLPRLVRTLAALADARLDDGTANFPPTSIALSSIDTGNQAANVIPAEARAAINIRFNNLHTPESLKAWVREVCAAHAGSHELAFRVSADAFLTQPSPFVDVVADAVEQITGRRPHPNTLGGTSDARYIKDHCPVVELGLVGRTMHKVDEHVAVADLEQLTACYTRILETYFGPDPVPR